MPSLSAKPKQGAGLSSTPRQRPSFKSPPVVEVACSVRFRPLNKFEAPHYGLFWELIRKQYPRTRTIAPIVPTVPVEAMPDQQFPVQMMLNAPEYPRVWFISRDDTWLVQLQPDMFSFNWREGPNATPYPRYKEIIKKFKFLYAQFEKFVSNSEVGTLSLLNCELTYINHLKQGQGWANFGDIGEIFPDLSWRRGKRFLSEPINLVFRSNHVMPQGHLQTAIQSARSVRDKAPVVRFDITARVTVEELSSAEPWRWFDNANEWIVDAFVDFTSNAVQREIWRRER